MAGSFDFGLIRQRLGKIKERVERETHEWERKGEEATAKGTASYECQQVVRVDLINGVIE